MENVELSFMSRDNLLSFDSLRNFIFSNVIVIQKRILPPLLFRMVRLIKRKVVYDLDDAIYLKLPGKKKEVFVEQLKKSDQIIVGNKTLKSDLLKYNNNIVVVPTPTEDLLFQDNKEFNYCVGWTGTSYNLNYLKDLEAVFVRLAEKYPGFHLKVISNEPYTSSRFKVVNVNWDSQSESDFIKGFDIGVMPLHDSLWEQSKCSYKLLKYMYHSIPGVASPVGMNVEVINDGVDGLLASTEEEWFDAIDLLFSDEELRNTIRYKGWKKSQDKYGRRYTAEMIKETLQDVISR